MSYGAAGAWGARVGPPFVRRVQDTGRPLALAALLAVLLLTLTLFVGVGVLALVSDVDEAWVATLIAGCFLLPAVGALVMTLETIARWWWRGRRGGGAVLVPAPSGAASTAVLRHRASLVTPWTVGLGSVAWCVVMAVATDSPPWLRVVFSVLALAATSLVAALVTGRAVPGGVYLTPQAVELRWGVSTVTLPWEEVPWGPTGAALRSLRRTPGTIVDVTFPVQIPTDVTDLASGGDIVVPTAYLSLPPEQMWALVSLGRSSAAARQHFGEPRSLEWRVEPAG